VVTGVVPSQNANPDLKWETTAQTNIAADYGFFGDRLTGSVEYYVKNTKDLLLSVDVAQPAPVQTQLQNIGRVRNRGFEASMDGQIINEVGRNWTAGLVLSVERNKVVDLGGRQFIPTGQVSGQGQSGQRAQRILPGQPIGTFFGPEFAGINAEGKQLFNKYTVTRDANGREVSRVRDGTTLTPGGDDNVILGNANPNFSLGLRNQMNFGKFDGSFLLRAVQGGKVFNNTALVYADKNLAVQRQQLPPLGARRRAGPAGTGGLFVALHRGRVVRAAPERDRGLHVRPRPDPRRRGRRGRGAGRRRPASTSRPTTCSC
jgi:iron complex outermembrane receptor protein